MTTILKRLTALLLCLLVVAAPAQQVVGNDSSVVVASPWRTGMNLGCSNFYESCQILKNLVGYNNPGFEATTTRLYFDLTSTSTSTTFLDTNRFSTFPTNYWAGGTFTVVESINSSASLNCTGTIASQTGPNRSYVTHVNWDGVSQVQFTAATGASSWVVGTSTVTIPALQTSGYLVNKTGTVTAQSGSTFTVTISSPPTHAASNIADFGFVQTNSTYSAPVYTVSSACSGPFTVGDQIILTKTTTPTPEYLWEGGYGGVFNSAVAGGAQMLSDTTDLCATCGSQALNLHFPNSGGTASFVQFYDTNASEDIFTLMNGVYQVSFWAKSPTGSPTLSVTANRGGTGGFSCSTLTPTLTTTWTQYTLNCTAAETASGVRPTDSNAGVFVSAGAGGGASDVYIDNLTFQKTSPVDSTNTSVLSDGVVAALRSLAPNPCSAPLTVRYWINQNAESIDNWTRPWYTRNPTGVGFATQPGGDAALQLSINDFLVAVANLQTTTGCPVYPYFEMPVTMSTTDAANLVEFLAGNSGSTYGQRRITLGQTTPWTSVFAQIYASFCNECWNGSFTGQNIQGDSRISGGGTIYWDYAVRSRDIYAAMRADSFYPGSGLNLGMNFQTANDFDANIAVALAHPDYPEVEGYTYGTANSFATPAAIWQPYMFEPYMRMTNSSDPHKFYASWNYYPALTTCGSGGTTQCVLPMYEWGEGTISGNIASNQASLDVVNVGAGGGVPIALQSLITQQTAPAAFGPQNYFALTEFRNGSAGSATAKLWGAIVEAGGAQSSTNSAAYGGQYMPRPNFLAIQLVNKSIIGPMYSCPISSNLLYNFAGSTQNGSPTEPAQNNVPYLYSFCFKNGSNRSMVLINTDTVNAHAVTWSGTVPAGTVTVRRYSVGASPNSLNEAPTGTYTGTFAGTVGLTTGTLTNPTGDTLPTYSINAYDWLAGSLPTAVSPSFSPGTGTYGSAQTVAITSPTPGALIHYSFNCSLYTSSPVPPITVSSSDTVCAYATATGYNDSPISSANYTIGGATTGVIKIWIRTILDHIL